MSDTRRSRSLACRVYKLMKSLPELAFVAAPCQERLNQANGPLLKMAKHAAKVTYVRAGKRRNVVKSNELQEIREKLTVDDIKSRSIIYCRKQV